MDFREYATKEAAASVRRAVARSAEASGKQLEAVRAALDAAAKALASATPGPQDEQDIADFVVRLTKEASDAAGHAAKQVADEAQKTTDALRAELQTTVKQKMAVAASLKEAQAQVEAARAELKTATDRSEAISKQLGEARKASEKLEAAKGEMAAARDELVKARAAVEADLQKTRQTLEDMRGQLAQAAKQVERAVADKTAADEAASAAHSASQASEAKLSAVTDLFKQSSARVKVLERAQQDHEKAMHDLATKMREKQAPAPAAESVSPVPVFDELLAGFQALSGATTITDVLTTLVEQLAAQFPRVALFRVKKSHLQGEHQIGFDLKTDIAKVVMPLGMDSLLARAAGSGTIERLVGDELKATGGAPFSGAPHAAIALPVMAGGEPLAIIYADDSGAPHADAGEVEARFAEAMQQHAAALISRMTNELKALAELKAYAGSLVRELEQMHAADAQANMSSDDLQVRLKGNLEYARSIYGSRIALEGADAAALLEDEIAAIIQAQKGKPFARDLAAAAGRPELGKRNAAEAS